MSRNDTGEEYVVRFGDQILLVFDKTEGGTDLPRGFLTADGMCSHDTCLAKAPGTRVPDNFEGESGVVASGCLPRGNGTATGRSFRADPARTPPPRFPLSRCRLFVHGVPGAAVRPEGCLPAREEAPA